jgi:hypothetical protein
VHENLSGVTSSLKCSRVIELHPEESLKIRKTEAKNEYRKFYERMINAGMV